MSCVPEVDEGVSSCFSIPNSTYRPQSWVDLVDPGDYAARGQYSPLPRFTVVDWGASDEVILSATGSIRSRVTNSSWEISLKNPPAQLGVGNRLVEQKILTVQLNSLLQSVRQRADW